MTRDDAQSLTAEDLRRNEIAAIRAAAMKEAAEAVMVSISSSSVKGDGPKISGLWLMSAIGEARTAILALAETPAGYVCVKSEELAELKKLVSGAHEPNCLCGYCA
jgi:hypothetical protein